METTPTTLHISLFWNPGVFIDTREEGARGQPLAQNVVAVAIVRLWKRGLGRIFAALLGLRAWCISRLSPVRSCAQFLVLHSWF